MSELEIMIRQNELKYYSSCCIVLTGCELEKKVIICKDRI